MDMEDVILENIWANWHIEKLIGSGSFGSVYMARRGGFGFEHDFYSAVKVIRVPAEDSELKGLLADGMTMEQAQAYYDSALKNLVKEIELMETLKGSPNIVTIEDYEVRKNESGVGWTIYIRMELLKNLNQYRTEHPLSVDDIVHLGMDMCSALEYCAKKNIVHRDIKPDNIFVNEFGDFKLGDFGIARHLEMTAAHLSQKGTSAYMAPEIYRGDPYNATVDIYSLGIVLYRLLNKGRLPFMPPYPKPISYEDTENAMARRLGGEPMPEPAEGGRLLADIVRRACSADMNFRYQNPADMKNDLFRWQVSGRHTQAATTETGTIPVLPSDGGSFNGQNGRASGNLGPARTDTTSDFNQNTGNGEHTAFMFAPNGRETQRNIWGPDAGNQAAYMPGGQPQARGMSGAASGMAGANQGMAGAAPGAPGGQPGGGAGPGWQNAGYSNQGQGAGQNAGYQAAGGRNGGYQGRQVQGQPGAAKKKNGSKVLAIVLSSVIGVAVVLALVFFLVPVGRETLFNKVMYAISDTDTRFNSSMEKGDSAYADGDYETALYYYEEKALAENSRSVAARIGVLKCHAADTSVSEERRWNMLLSDLTAIRDLPSELSASQQQDVINAVNSWMDARGEALVTELADNKHADVASEVSGFFDLYQQCSDAVGGKVDCAADNARWYPVFYDILIASEGCEEYAVELLAEGFSKYPEDTEIVSRQAEVDQASIAKGYDEINQALSEGDFTTAYARAEEIQPTLGQEEYTNLLRSIEYIEERTQFLTSLKSMLDSGNYDSLAKAIQNDSAGGFSTCYLVDGVYMSSVSEGTALLYDNNGVYYGQIKDDRRYGSGIQLKYYSDGSYQLLEGTWDGNANGQCTYTWWTADGTQAVVTGNFTDGYEDGTMNISWRQDGRNWSANYPADHGTYTEIRKDETGASIYVIAFDDDGSSAWWTTTQLSGNGCFIN